MTSKEFKDKITEKTWVPLTALGLAFIVGVWCASLQSQTSSAAVMASHAHDQIEADERQLMTAIENMRTDIAIIKFKTESIEKALTKP